MNCSIKQEVFDHIGVPAKARTHDQAVSSGRNSKVLAKRVSSPRAQSSLATISQSLDDLPVGLLVFQARV